MLTRLSDKLLPVLQLTRMALVFTAIADGLSALLLAHRGQPFPIGAALAMAGVSVGLYGFGMSLNDIIDRRRDELIAATRPLPSGRLGVTTAHAVCALLGALAVACGVLFCMLTGQWASLGVLVVTGALIGFYDAAGKYLVWPGLLVLGLIRFCHAAIAAPSLPLVWHPLMLLNHVAILSTVAYVWEQKRPVLTRSHVALVGAGLLAINAAVIGFVGHRRAAGPTLAGWFGGLHVTPALLIPLGAALLFVAVAIMVNRHAPSARDAGQRVMLYGLLWLIVYDAAFVAGHVGWPSAAGVLLLLPLAYGSVRVVRSWAKLAALAQRPPYRRA